MDGTFDCRKLPRTRRSLSGAKKAIRRAWLCGDMSQIDYIMTSSVFRLGTVSVTVAYNQALTVPEARAEIQIIYERDVGLSSAKVMFPQPMNTIHTQHAFVEHVFALTHELFHVQMCLDEHPCVVSEFATDMCALLTMGCRESHQNLIARPDGFGYIDKKIAPCVYRALGL